MALHRSLLPFALAAGLGACDGPRTVADLPSSAYSLGEFSYAAGGRDLRTEVYGNPFGGDPAAFAQAVTDAMQGNNFGPSTHFTTTPNDSARPIYKVVLAFTTEADRLPRLRSCEPFPAQPGGPPPSAAGVPITVQAAFCRGGGELTGVTGWLDGARSPQDPQFQSLIRQVTLDLFPPRNPEMDGCAGPFC